MDRFLRRWDKIRVKHDAKSFYFQFARLILWNFIFLSRLIVLWKTEFHFQRSMWLLYLLKALIYSSLYIYSFFDRWNKNFDPITLFVFPILEISKTFKNIRLCPSFHTTILPLSIRLFKKKEKKNILHNFLLIIVHESSASRKIRWMKNFSSNFLHLFLPARGDSLHLDGGEDGGRTRRPLIRNIYRPLWVERSWTRHVDGASWWNDRGFQEE